MKDSIDFILVAYYRFEQVKVLVDSIVKYVKYPYDIYIVNNGDMSGVSELEHMFSEYDNVHIKFGVEQSKLNHSDIISGNYQKYRCKIDGRHVGIGSYTQAVAMDIGVRTSNSKYICYCDTDVVFLNQWGVDLIDELNDKVFVSHLWRHDIDMQPSAFCLLKRDTIENNYLNEKDDLYPNIDYKDTNGMLSLWARKVGLPFLILKNSFQDKSLKREHILNVSHGEQSWYNNIPILHHYGHGVQREDYKYDEWISETTKYLGLNYN
jgi:hypothetical protein